MCILTKNKLQTHFLKHKWQFTRFAKALFAPYFLPIHHPSCDITTCPKWILPIQMVGEQTGLYKKTTVGVEHVWQGWSVGDSKCEILSVNPIQGWVQMVFVFE